jgi:hypothetical protein
MAISAGYNASTGTGIAEDTKVRADGIPLFVSFILQRRGMLAG